MSCWFCGLLGYVDHTQHKKDEFVWEILPSEWQHNVKCKQTFGCSVRQTPRGLVFSSLPLFGSRALLLIWRAWGGRATGFPVVSYPWNGEVSCWPWGLPPRLPLGLDPLCVLPQCWGSLRCQWSWGYQPAVVPGKVEAPDPGSYCLGTLRTRSGTLTD